jgi:hypothetical protein
MWLCMFTGDTQNGQLQAFVWRLSHWMLLQDRSLKALHSNTGAKWLQWRVTVTLLGILSTLFVHNDSSCCSNNTTCHTVCTKWQQLLFEQYDMSHCLYTMTAVTVRTIWHVSLFVHNDSSYCSNNTTCHTTYSLHLIKAAVKQHYLIQHDAGKKNSCS